MLCHQDGAKAKIWAQIKTARYQKCSKSALLTAECQNFASVLDVSCARMLFV